MCFCNGRESGFTRQKAATLCTRSGGTYLGDAKLKRGDGTAEGGRRADDGAVRCSHRGKLSCEGGLCSERECWWGNDVPLPADAFDDAESEAMLDDGDGGGFGRRRTDMVGESY